MAQNKIDGDPIYDHALNKFDWEKLIINEHKEYIAPPLNKTTKHVLLTLAVWMSGPRVDPITDQDQNAVEGYRCYPSTRRIAENTGLSQRCVIEHVNLASDTGWLQIWKKGYGKSWRSNEYIPCMPISTIYRADGE